MSEEDEDPASYSWTRLFEFRDDEKSPPDRLTLVGEPPDTGKDAEGSQSQSGNGGATAVSTNPGDEPGDTNTLAAEDATQSLFLYGFLGKDESLQEEDGEGKGRFYCFDCVTVDHFHEAATKARELAKTGEPLPRDAHKAFVEAYFSDWAGQFRLLELVLPADGGGDDRLRTAANLLPELFGADRWWVLEVLAPESFPGPPTAPDAEKGSRPDGTDGGGASGDGAKAAGRGGGDGAPTASVEKLLATEDVEWLRRNASARNHAVVGFYEDGSADLSKARRRLNELVVQQRKSGGYRLEYREISLGPSKDHPNGSVILMVEDLESTAFRAGEELKTQSSETDIDAAIGGLKRTRPFDKLATGARGKRGGNAQSGGGSARTPPPPLDGTMRGPGGGARVSAYLAFDSVETGNPGPREDWDLLAIYTPSDKERAMLDVLVSLAQIPNAAPGDGNDLRIMAIGGAEE